MHPTFKLLHWSNVISGNHCNIYMSFLLIFFSCDICIGLQFYVWSVNVVIILVMQCSIHYSLVITHRLIVGTFQEQSHFSLSNNSVVGQALGVEATQYFWTMRMWLIKLSRYIVSDPLQYCTCCITLTNIHIKNCRKFCINVLWNLLTPLYYKWDFSFRNTSYC